MKTKRLGFTLIELLVVILIIGLLAGISGGAFMAARRMFAGLTAKQEMDNIIRALEEYKATYGEYPPDEFATDQEIKRHILKRWPNLLKTANKTNSVLSKSIEYVKNNIPEQGQLLFWLCGPPTYDQTPGNMGRRGFSTNIENPFGLFCNNNGEFTTDLLDELALDNNGNETMSFAPMNLELSYDLTKNNRHSGNCDGYNLIYKDRILVYFRAGREPFKVQGNNVLNYGAYADPRDVTRIKSHDFTEASDAAVTELGIAVPYAKATAGSWYGQDSYQLLGPGEDGCYGTNASGNRFKLACIPETGENMTMEDADNVTNFASGATLSTEQQ